jgi:hypothetical protein
VYRNNKSSVGSGTAVRPPVAMRASSSATADAAAPACTTAFTAAVTGAPLFGGQGRRYWNHGLRRQREPGFRVRERGSVVLTRSRVR